jgi:predicted secreted protein
MSRALALLLALVAASAAAQVTRYESAPAPQPIVTVTASASATVVNDRMHAALRAESENADAAQAARDVNARIARALAKAKAIAGVAASTAGYSSYQVGEKERMRWRVSQGLSLEGSDFATLAALVSRLQAEDGLLVSGLAFPWAPTANGPPRTSSRSRRSARGSVAPRPPRRGSGHVVASGPRHDPAGRGRASAAGDADAGDGHGGGAAPISAEAGTTEIAVSVSGEVILETVRSAGTLTRRVAAACISRACAR